MKIVYFIVIVFAICGCSTAQVTNVKFIKEKYPYECGPRCLQMIFESFGKEIEFEEIANRSNMDSLEGTSILDLSETAKFYNFETLIVKSLYSSINDDEFSLQDAPLPAIAHWQGNYFVVVEKVTQNKSTIVHPKLGRIVLSREDFKSSWLQNDSNMGVIMLLEDNN